MSKRIVILGFGNVGRMLVRELVERRLNRLVEVRAILSSRGGVLGGLSEAYRLALEKERLDEHPGFIENLGLMEVLREERLDAAMIAIPPSYESGEPNLTMYEKLLEHGVSIITADKTGLALRYKQLMGEAARRRLYVGYRATVAAGIPAIDAAKGLKGRSIQAVRAVLNATTNYALSLVEEGMSYSDALRRMGEMGLAEPDPSIDAEGWDPAAKIAILASTLGYEASLRDVEGMPLNRLSEDEVRRAPSRGYRAKYLAEADLEKGRLKVYPALIPLDNPLAKTRNNQNTILFELEGETILLSGPVGPAWRTAKTMITDLLEYLEATGITATGMLGGTMRGADLR